MTFKIHNRPLAVTESDLWVLRMARWIGRVRGRGFASRLSSLLRWQPPPEAPGVVRIKDRRIRIVYRHVSYSDDARRFPSKHRPAQFSYEKCLSNLLETIAASRYSDSVSLHLYYNGTAEDFADDASLGPLENYQGAGDVRFISAGSALEAYLVMLRSVRDSQYAEDDVLYLLENDYLHHENWVDEVMGIFDSGVRFDYLSLYDHPDRYRLPHRYDRSKLYATASRHWVTAPSTCASFLLTSETFARDFRNFYTHKVDHRLFTDLLRWNRRVLLTPVPGLATHCMEAHLDRVNRFERYFGDR